MRTLQTEIIRNELYKKEKQQALPKQRPKLKMSKHEIEELMGVRRPTYKRSRGAIRQK